MLADVWKLGAICALIQVGAAHVAADSLPLEKSLKLGRPARPVVVTVSAGDTLTIKVAGSTHTVPARHAQSVELTAISVAEDASVALLRVTAENGPWVALLGGRSGKELLAADHAEPWGDPGERRALRVTAAPLQAGSTLQQVSLGMEHEGLARCGDGAPWLRERRSVDPKSLTLVGSPDPTPARAATSLEVHSAGAKAPKLALLSAASSSQLDPLTHGVQVPHALVDGRADSSLRLERGGLALLRWSAPALPITQLSLLLAGRSGPATLRLDLQEAAFELMLPKPSAGEDRVAIDLPATTRSACLSLQLISPEAMQLAEVQAFSSVDAPEGLERLVSDLVQDGERAALAAELLPQLGEPAARQVAVRYPELSPRGQRRALKTLQLQLQLPEVLARLVEAARSPDEALRQAAFEVLRHGKQPGRDALAQLALGADPTGDRAVQALSQRGSSDPSALLAALSTPQGADRPALRRALVSVGRREPDALRAAVATWATTGPSLHARIGLALPAALAELDDLALPLVEEALAASEFEDRFRLSLAAAELGASTKIDAWLVEQSQNAKEWMQRRAAYEALLGRNQARAQALSAQLAKDPYPRVRAATATALAQAGQGAALTELARNDPWPLVRSAAASGLGAIPHSRPVLEALLGDSSRFVRTASIEGLLRQREAASWPLVAERLSAENEWPVVQAAAVRFAAGLCVQAAHPALAATARRSLRPDASEDDRVLGMEAIRALHDLGGQAAEDARLIATREAASPQLKQAFSALGPSRCGASAALVAP